MLVERALKMSKHSEVVCHQEEVQRHVSAASPVEPPAEAQPSESHQLRNLLARSPNGSYKVCSSDRQLVSKRTKGRVAVAAVQHLTSTQRKI